MKLLFQECILRGKQIQIPVLGHAYKTIEGKTRHGSGGWINLNICTPRQAKLGKTIGNEIIKILREHGYEFEITMERKANCACEGV